jgi:hypothetical protein
MLFAAMHFVRFGHNATYCGRSVALKHLCRSYFEKRVPRLDSYLLRCSSVRGPCDKGPEGMHDSRAVAAIVGVLRQVHGDDTARLMLQDGMTLEALIDALLRAPLSDRDSARLMGAALESGDFVITPDFTTCVSHLKFIYAAPGSFRVRDIVMLTEQGAFSSAEIGLRLRA